MKTQSSELRRVEELVREKVPGYVGVEMQLTRLKGLTNSTFRIDPAPTAQSAADLPSLVYQLKNVGLFDRTIEMLVIRCLQELKIAPSCYHLTPSEVLSEFVEGAHPSLEELTQAEFLQPIFQKIKLFHSVDIPELKERGHFFENLKKKLHELSRLDNGWL